MHKGGDTDDPGNYCPISIVPIVAKVLEKIIATQLSYFMEHHYLLHDLQGAYRQGRLADQILLYATDTILFRLWIMADLSELYSQIYKKLSIHWTIIYC